jgi:hypothetical protein
VVLPLLAPSLDAWHSELSRIVPPSCMLLLPSESYHVTSMGLWTRPQFPTCEAYNQRNTAAKAALEALDAELATFPQLQMKVDSKEGHTRFSLHLEPADANSATLWKRAHRLIQQRFPELRASRPHLSLAYAAARNAPALSPEQVEAVRLHMKKLPTVLTFGAPRCCGFRDMTAFVPLFAAPSAAAQPEQPLAPGSPEAPESPQALRQPPAAAAETPVPKQQQARGPSYASAARRGKKA